MRENDIFSKKTCERIILVGTYKGDQLALWKGWYNYPISSQDEINLEDISKINELWLFRGKNGQKNYKAEFVGIKTREELVNEYNYPAQGKPHGNKYLLFKTEFMYTEESNHLEFADKVIIRLKDFATSPKIREQLYAYLHSSDRNDPNLSKCLPAIISTVPCDRLYVCEAAIQLELFTSIKPMLKVDISETLIPAQNNRNDVRYVAENALDFMKELPRESVQLIVTSPPYNIGKEYEARVSIERYLESVRPIIAEIGRIISNTGSVCWQVGNYIEDGEVFPLDIFYYRIFKEFGFKLRNRIIWHFGHGLHCKNRFSGRYETILWFSKTDEYDFYLDAVRIPSKYPGKRYYKGSKKGQLSGNPLGKNPEDLWTLHKVVDDWDCQVWEIPNVKSNHPEKVDHPCQFPLELVERCILALSKTGDIVYDPFAGVGTTVIGAIKNGRIGYGTELEQKYVDIGNQRIQALRDGVLKYRPITQEIFDSSKAGRLAQLPEEWKIKE